MSMSAPLSALSFIIDNFCLMTDQTQMEQLPTVIPVRTLSRLRDATRKPEGLRSADQANSLAAI